MTRCVRGAGRSPLFVMAGFQIFNVLANTSLLLLPTIRTWRPGDHSKATLDRRKGYVLLSLYLCGVAICAPILIAVGKSSS